MKKILFFMVFIFTGNLYDFIYAATDSDPVCCITTMPVSQLNSRDYHNCRGGLNNSALRFTKEKKGRVAFLGGSITWNGGWRDSVTLFLQEQYPAAIFEFINAGIPSFGSTPDAFRIDRDVLSSGRIDLLFVEAAVNDRTNGFSDIAQVRAMEGIVRKSRESNSRMDIIILYFVDPDKIADYHKGIVPSEILSHEKVASHYNLPSVNLAREVNDRIDNKEFTWEGDFKNVHPSPFGQHIYFRSIKCLLENCLEENKMQQSKILPYPLPSRLDQFSYDKGELIEAGKANTDKSWILEMSWVPGDKKGTRKDFVDVPMLICTSPGAINLFRFSGTAVGIAVASGPDAGIIEYSIDNSAWNSRDLFTLWSRDLHLPWFLTLNDDLNPGSHTLKIRLKESNNKLSSGTACRIRYFYVNKR